MSRPINLLWLLLFGAACLLLGYFCSPKPKPAVDLVQSDTLYIPGDSTTTVIEKLAPYPVFIDTGNTRWRNMPIDTMAILADYMARVGYKRVLKDDTSAYCALTDTLSRNRLMGYRFEFINRRPTQVIHNTYQAAAPPQTIWYLGGGVATLPNKLLVMPGVAMQDKRQRIWFAKADIRLQAVEVGAYVPIWRQKPKKP